MVPFWWIAAPFGLSLPLDYCPKASPSDGSRIGSDAIQLRILPGAAIPPSPPGSRHWGAIQARAPSLGFEIFPVDVRDAGELERAFAGLGAHPKWRHHRDGELHGSGSA